MPTYKNRPPMDPDTPVWRYLSLNAVIATVRDRQLRFTRVDRFKDPFEGSVPKQTIDDQVLLLAHRAAGRPARNLRRCGGCIAWTTAGLV